jgi:hypothetical protein
LGEVSPNRNYVFPNRDMIKLSYDEDQKAVLAEASEPCYVINEALGHKIKVDLRYFKSDNIFTNLSIYKYFQENLSEEPNEKTKQLENREKAYFQIMRYFLVSLKDGRVDENNYDVYKIIKMNQTFLGRTTLMQEVSEGRLVPISQKEIYAYDSKSGKHFLHTNQPLLVFNKNYASYQNNPFRDYYYEFSKIELPNYLVEFNENGYITRSNGLILHNRWSKEGLGRQLPANYRPEGYEQNSAPTEKQLQSMDISAISAKQMKLDSMVLRRPDRLDQAATTFNIPIEKGDEPDYFYEPDISYKLVARDANQSIFQILKRVPSLRVVLNNNTGEYDIFLQSGNTSLMSGGDDKTPNLVINNRVYRTKQEVMDQLIAIDTRQVKEVGLIKYGGGAIFGATGGHGTIVILMDNYRNVH